MLFCLLVVLWSRLKFNIYSWIESTIDINFQYQQLVGLEMHRHTSDCCSCLFFLWLCINCLVVLVGLPYCWNRKTWWDNKSHENWGCFTDKRRRGCHFSKKHGYLNKRTTQVGSIYSIYIYMYIYTVYIYICIYIHIYIHIYIQYVQTNWDITDNVIRGLVPSLWGVTATLRTELTTRLELNCTTVDGLVDASTPQKMKCATNQVAFGCKS